MSDAAASPSTFKPSRRQAGFRDFVRALYDQQPAKDGTFPVLPRRMAGDWIASQRQPPPALKVKPPSPAVTMREWVRWERGLQFRAWWGQAFPEWANPSEYDLELLAGDYYRGLSDHMAKGEPWAFQQVGRIERDRRQAKEEQGTIHEDLDAWLKKDTSGWDTSTSPSDTADGAPRGRSD